MSRRAAFVVLLCLGAGWGLTVPLTKIAVRDGYGHFGLVFWQLALGAAVLGAIQLIRRRPLPLTARGLAFCLGIALIGTVIPNSASYQAAVHLPGGIMALVIALVPMAAFPIALALGIDDFAPRRLAGLALGLAAMALIALPGASLPPGTAAFWVLVGLVAPLCYAVEANAVAKLGTFGLGPIQTLFGASVLGAAVALPLAVGSGQFIAPPWPFGAADWAVIGLSTIHALVYSGYVWLVGRTGSVFAAQVAYLVTGFGVFWSMILLGERYPVAVWAAFGLLMAGLALVQPRLVSAPAASDDGGRSSAGLT